MNEETFQLESSYMAKWVLPNEGMPLYITWHDFSDFDYIEINKTDGLIIREYYNVEKEKEDNCLIYRDELCSIGYLGIVFSHPNINEISVDVSVCIRFIKSGKELFVQSFKSKIIRPIITIEVPDKINILKNKKNLVDIKLKYEGYGIASGKILVTKDNKDISFNIKNFNDLTFMLVNHKLFKKLPKEFLIFESKIDLDEIPDDQYLYREYMTSKFELENLTQVDFQNAITTIIENEALKDMLDKRIEETLDFTNSFFRSIINFIENRPVEDVFLIDAGEKEIDILKDENMLFINICYVDDIGNLYESRKRIKVITKEDDLLILDKEWENNPGDWKWLKEKNT